VSLSDDQWVFLTVGLGGGGVLLVIIGYIALRIVSRPRGLRRPDFSLMLADTQYYRKALHAIFKERGYKVTGFAILKDTDPTVREPYEIVFSLRKGSELYCAFCVRLVVPVTSDVISRYEKALHTTRATHGMIVTTSTFSFAALERAKGLPIELYDCGSLQKWIDHIWPA